jgi:hypothetical protein
MNSPTFMLLSQAARLVQDAKDDLDEQIAIQFHGNARLTPLTFKHLKASAELGILVRSLAEAADEVDLLIGEPQRQGAARLGPRLPVLGRCATTGSSSGNVVAFARDRPPTTPSRS